MNYQNMSVVELITVCNELGIEYHDGGEILDADTIRAILGEEEEEVEE